MPDTLAPPRPTAAQRSPEHLASEYAFNVEIGCQDVALNIQRLMLVPLAAKQIGELTRARDDLLIAVAALTRKLTERVASTSIERGDDR